MSHYLRQRAYPRRRRMSAFNITLLLLLLLAAISILAMFFPGRS